MDKREAEVARLARPIAARRRALLRRALWLPWLAVGLLLLLCGIVSAWLNWEATKEEEAPGALRLSWMLAVVGSLLLDWLLLEPLVAMRHELTHIAEQRRWARLP